MRSLILTAAIEEHHQDSISGQRERYRDMVLGMKDFFAEQLEATTTRLQFDPLQLDDSSHQGA
jgi:hypothetical protein